MLLFFFFNDTATTEIYTLSLHDALPILFTGSYGVRENGAWQEWLLARPEDLAFVPDAIDDVVARSEEHTSELQSQSNLVCRLLLEKKKNILREPMSVKRSGT